MPRPRRGLPSSAQAWERGSAPSRPSPRSAREIPLAIGPQSWNRAADLPVPIQRAPCASKKRTAPIQSREPRSCRWQPVEGIPYHRRLFNVRAVPRRRERTEKPQQPFDRLAAFAVLNRLSGDLLLRGVCQNLRIFRQTSDLVARNDRYRCNNSMLSLLLISAGFILALSASRGSGDLSLDLQRPLLRRR